MYALFPEPARDYLTMHQEGAESAVFLMGEEFDTMKEDAEVDVTQIRELIKIVELSDVGEVTVEEAGMKVTVRKGGVSVTTADATIAPSPSADDGTAAGGEVSAAAVTEQTERPGTWKPVSSPMVGTFYRRPSPDQDPYVDAGSRIDAETVVCIVEAMKVNNEIKAEMSGEVIEVLVEDGQPVEFDQPLFRVKS